MASAQHLQDDQAQAVKAIFNIYADIGFKPPPKQFTVLGAFYLTKRPPQTCDTGNPQGFLKIISLSTGTKCTPATRYSPRGELVHDSHAEVLTRRGAVRWFLEEIRRIKTLTDYTSEWLSQTDRDSSKDSDERPSYCLQDGVELGMYVSTLPCMFPSCQPRNPSQRS